MVGNIGCISEGEFVGVKELNSVIPDTDPRPLGQSVLFSKVSLRHRVLADREEIKDRLGPPDLALLPIAAGACLPFIERLLHIRLDQISLTRHLHAPPGDAVQVHRDLGARSSIGIHWGTFTTDLGARQTRADFETVKEGGSELYDVGVWTAGRSQKMIDDGDVVHIVAEKTVLE